MAKIWGSSAVHISSLAEDSWLLLMIFLAAPPKGEVFSRAEARGAQRGKERSVGENCMKGRYLSAMSSAPGA